MCCEHWLSESEDAACAKAEQIFPVPESLWGGWESLCEDPSRSPAPTLEGNEIHGHNKETSLQLNKQRFDVLCNGTHFSLSYVTGQESKGINKGTHLCN